MGVCENSVVKLLCSGVLIISVVVQLFVAAAAAAAGVEELQVIFFGPCENDDVVLDLSQSDVSKVRLY